MYSAANCFVFHCSVNQYDNNARTIKWEAKHGLPPIFRSTFEKCKKTQWFNCTWNVSGFGLRNWQKKQALSLLTSCRIIPVNTGSAALQIAWTARRYTQPRHISCSGIRHFRSQTSPRPSVPTDSKQLKNDRHIPITKNREKIATWCGSQLRTGEFTAKFLFWTTRGSGMLSLVFPDLRYLYQAGFSSSRPSSAHWQCFWRHAREEFSCTLCRIGIETCACNWATICFVCYETGKKIKVRCRPVHVFSNDDQVPFLLESLATLDLEKNHISKAVLIQFLGHSENLWETVLTSVYLVHVRKTLQIGNCHLRYVSHFYVCVQQASEVKVTVTWWNNRDIVQSRSGQVPNKTYSKITKESACADQQTFVFNL